MCIRDRGTVKKPVEAAELREGHGIVGDAHAGAWHRQVSLLALESVEKMRSLCGADLPYGVFAENFLTQGIDLKTLPVGARLQVGPCVLKITQIGKECHGAVSYTHLDVYKRQVYISDAATSDGVEVVASAPEGSHKPVNYPASVLKGAAHPEEAKAFLEYLKGGECKAVFESIGFGVPDR